MLTMTDAMCVNTYVNELRFNAFKNWGRQTPEQRATAMHEAVTRVHSMCGIPKTTVRVANIGTSHGLFQFSKWEIEMNVCLYQDAYLDLNNIDPYFVYVAEILYHEARHCEQWWHMARYVASNARSPSFLAREKKSPVLQTLPVGSIVLTTEGANYIKKVMNIPQNIAEQALKSYMKSGDQMMKLTQDWYKSVYGESNRTLVLTALALKRRIIPGENAILLNDFREDICRKYSGGLPEEVDAWGIQTLVKQAFKRYQLTP